MGFIKSYFPRVVLFFFYLFLTSILNIVHADDPEIGNMMEESSFSYVDGDPKGPQNWGNLNYPEWIKCRTGIMQSPIDIPLKNIVLSIRLGPLRNLYKSGPAIIQNRGHDIAVEWRGDAGGIILNGVGYKLKQMHWHTPAEHTFNGARYNMELHLVHSNSKGDIAVIGVFYVIGPPDPFLQRISSYLPKVNENGTDLGFVHPLETRFDISSYYRYDGSLTVPPCSENVIWTLVRKVNSVSMEQVKALRDAVHDGDVGNARPVQPLKGRTIFLNRF